MKTPQTIGWMSLILFIWWRWRRKLALCLFQESLLILYSSDYVLNKQGLLCEEYFHHCTYYPFETKTFPSILCSPALDGVVFTLITESYINILLNQKYDFLLCISGCVLQQNLACICGMCVCMYKPELKKILRCNQH